MVVYTKAQLINAYCELKHCTKEQIVSILAEEQVRIDRMLAMMPTNARVEAKNQAIRYLARKESEQALIDNEAIEF